MIGKIIQLIPAPERLFESRKNEYGIERGQMDETNLFCLALTDQGEILLVTDFERTAKYWANKELKIIKPYATIEQNE